MDYVRRESDFEFFICTTDKRGWTINHFTKKNSVSRPRARIAGVSVDRRGMSANDKRMRAPLNCNIPLWTAILFKTTQCAHKSTSLARI